MAGQVFVRGAGGKPELKSRFHILLETIQLEIWTLGFKMILKTKKRLGYFYGLENT